MKYWAPIDPHVHLRGEEYAGIPFLEWGFSDAEAVGIQALCEMPNPQPWLTSVDAIGERMRKVAELNRKVRHKVHIGITNDKNQARSALLAVMEGASGLVSDKAFYYNSTGNMGLTKYEYQEWLWQQKGDMSYNGVSLGHFEEEENFFGDFDPSNPESHSVQHSEESEVVAVEKQYRFAIDSRFQGVFYVCHISSPETVAFLDGQDRIRRNFKVIKEVTWHHLFLNTYAYRVLGHGVKMNPPLRHKISQLKLLDLCLNGHLDIIGSDHAPHPEARKQGSNPASGIPTLPFWPKGIELLRKLGIKEDLLRGLTFDCANSLFKFGLAPKEVDCEYNTDLWAKYGFNPFITGDETTPSAAFEDRVIWNPEALDRVNLDS